MELSRSERPAKVILRGEDEFPVENGQKLKVETSPNGDERMNEGPPAGKKWKIVSMSLEIIEEDA